MAKLNLNVPIYVPGPEKAPTVYVCRQGHEQEGVSHQCLTCRGLVVPKKTLDRRHAQGMHGLAFGGTL